MEEIRAEGCKDESEIAERAVRWARDTYGVPPGQHSSRAAAEISIEYAQPRDARETALSELLKQRKTLGWAGKSVTAKIRAHTMNDRKGEKIR